MLRTVTGMDPQPPRPAVHARESRASVGARGEDLAAEHLSRVGLEIVARNWRVALQEVRGELDLVALDHARRQVVICEVKTRSGPGFGGPLVAVTPRKQGRIRRLAGAFLMDARLPYREVRFDVVGIRIDLQPPRIDHVVAAF